MGGTLMGSLAIRSASAHPKLAFPKGITQQQVKARGDRDEARVKRINRAKVERRDGPCRILKLDRADLFGECMGVDEWNHLKKRSKTRNESPEDRHSTTITAMGCTRHHRLIDDGDLKFRYLTRGESRRADGMVDEGQARARRRTRRAAILKLLNCQNATRRAGARPAAQRRQRSMAIIRVTTQAELDAALDAAKAYDEIHIEGSGYFELARNPKSGSATVHASKYVAVQKMAPSVAVSGDGVVIVKPAITSVAQWCEYHDLPIVDGVVTLYKGVRGDYRSARGTSYAPGTVPVADDWDGGKLECGGGLHACARPMQTLSFDSEATKFVGCPVRVEDIRLPRVEDEYPTKVKFKGVPDHRAMRS